MPWPKGKPRPEYLKQRASEQMKGNQHARGYKQTEEQKRLTAEHMRGNQHALGSHRTDDQKKEISEKLLGNKRASGMRHTDETKAVMSEHLLGNKRFLGHKHTEETLRKLSEKSSGKNNAQYIDGCCYERQDDRRLASTKLEYRLWRNKVLDRDDYTCQLCGVRGGVLSADHIVPWCANRGLRYSVDNGRTLCIPCHRKTDTYGVNACKYKTEG